MKAIKACQFLLVLCLIVFPVVKVAATGLAFNCSVFHGFNWQKDEQVQVGFVESLKIGGIELKGDLNVKNPVDTRFNTKVAGVMSSLQWNGSIFDPISISAHISTANKNLVASLLKKSQPNLDVEIAFAIYDYDPQAKKYYKALHTDGKKLSCKVLNRGGESALIIDNEPAGDIKSPVVHLLALGIAPQKKAMEIHLSLSVTNKVIKKFGSETGKP